MYAIRLLLRKQTSIRDDVNTLSVTYVIAIVLTADGDGIKSSTNAPFTASPRNGHPVAQQFSGD
jgi:hypothetical protein